MGSAAKQGTDGGRRAERRALDASARIRPNSWSSLEVEMRDISELGFRALCEARLRAGATVTIDVPGIGAVDAQVEWQRGDEFGARFYQPIDLSRCEWTLSDRGAALAQLLVSRARARIARRPAAEARLRQEILAALPMLRGGAAA